MTITLVKRNGVYREILIDDGNKLQVYPLSHAISAALPIRFKVLDQSTAQATNYKIVVDI